MKHALAILIVVCCAGGPAFANPFDAYGTGARSVALGGAATASVRDTSANYYNPAALIRSEHLQLDFGYHYVQPQLSINGGDLGVDRTSGIQTGLSLPKKIGHQKVAVSLSFFLPDDRLTRIRSLPQSQPRFVLFDNRPQRVVITTSAAWEPFAGLSIGGGLTYLTSTRGAVILDGDISITDPENTLLVGGIDVVFESIRYPTAALHWEPNEHWRFGLTYRAAFQLELDLSVLATFDVTSTGSASEAVLVEAGNLALSSVSTNLFSPQQVVIGVQYAQGSWLVTADLSWNDWSAFPAPASVINLSLDTEDASFPLPETTTIEPPNFHDILIMRIGAEATVFTSPGWELEARAGYFYEPSPAPDQAGNTNYADSAKHGTSIGFGARVLDLSPILEQPLELSWVMQCIWMQPRSYLKNHPADAVGDYQIGGVILGTALTLGVLF